MISMTAKFRLSMNERRGAMLGNGNLWAAISERRLRLRHLVIWGLCLLGGCDASDLDKLGPFPLGYHPSRMAGT